MAYASKSLLYTHSFGFIQWDSNGHERYEENTGSIVIILVTEPENNAGDLKHVEWVHHL